MFLETFPLNEIGRIPDPCFWERKIPFERNWPNSFYPKIQCFFAFLSQNLMRFFHAFSYALWNLILPKNSLWYFGQFSAIWHFIAKSYAFLHFYRKIQCVLSMLNLKHFGRNLEHYGLNHKYFGRNLKHFDRIF